MKKFLTLLLALAMCVCTLCLNACGPSSKKEENGEKTLNVWVQAPIIHNYANALKLNPKDKQANLTKKIVEGFAKIHPEVKLNLINNGWGITLNEKLITSLNLNGSSAPDVVVGEQFVKTFINDGKFAALDLGDLEADIIDQAHEYMYKDNKVYAVPVTTGTYGLNVNLLMLRECQVLDEENNVKDAWRSVMPAYINAVNTMNSNYSCSSAETINPVAPVYYEDILAISKYARDYYDGKITVDGVGYDKNDGASKGGILLSETREDAPWQNLAYMRSAGGDFVDANGKVNLDTPENLKAYTFLRDLYNTAGNKGLVNTTQEFNVQFYNNYGIYAVQGSDLKTRAYKYNFKAEDINLTYLPVYSSNKLQSNLMVGSLFMSVNAKKKENLQASTDFIKYLLSDEVQYLFAQEDGRIPVKKSILNSEELTKISNYSDIEPLLNTFKDWNFSGMLHGFSDYNSQIWEAYVSFIKNLYSNTNLAEALTKANGTMKMYAERA